MSQNKNHGILAACIGGTLLLHLIFLFSINGMEVTFVTLGQGSLYDLNSQSENQLAGDASLREEELSAILNQLAEQQLPQEQPQEFDYLSFGADFVMPSLDDLTELEELVDEREESFLSIEEELALATPDTSPSFVTPSIPLDVQFEDATDLVDELIKATDVVEGLLDSSALAESLDGIQVGIEEVEGRGEDSLQRSGSMEEGSEDPFHTRGMVADSEMLQMMEQLGSSGTATGAHAGSGVTFGVDQPGTIASSRDFDMRVELTKNDDGDGYLFALHFVPKEGVQFKRVKHNMFFLIDRSHSIPKARFAAFKEGVKRALRWMKPGDTFNVMVFDKQVVRLADTPLPWSELSLTKADAFLDAQTAGGMFATTDLYSSLHKIIPEAVADTEINTAILFSDGDTYLRQEDQRRSIAGWTKSNRGKVSLYAVASGENNNLPLLEVLASFNRGRLVYAQTEQEVESVLRQILVTTRDPIGKDLVVTAIPKKDSTRISLYPRQSRLPDLYQGAPYTILGTINELESFKIFLQGKFYDRRFDIKQLVSFESPYGEGDNLPRQIAVSRAFDHYEEFLRDGRVRHLTAARKVLRPLRIPVAFQ